MAFTKTPTQDTYDTKRFPLVGMPQQRNGRDVLKDQRFLNCFPEQIKAQVTEAKKYYCTKRSGIIQSVAPAFGLSRGAIYEDISKKLFFVVGTALCSWNGSSLNAFGVIPGTDPVGFTLHLTTEVKVILLTGTNGYSINPQTDIATQIVDPDFPTPHLPFPISMDGYLFVAKANSADIYNSDLDNELAWTPGNFTTAEMYPDNIVAMTKNNNYVIAVGGGSTEFFYDAGTATGSPLQRNDSAVQQLGTGAAYSVVQTENEVVLIGNTGNGGRTVWVIEGFKAQEVGTEAVRMSLNDLEDDLSTVNAYCIRVMGHKFYVLRMPTVDRTWVYDFDSKLWHEWSTPDTGGTQRAFIGIYAADGPNGFPYMLVDISGLGGVFVMRDDVYQDIDRTITAQLTTLKLDFDNMNRKVASRMAIYGDWPLNTTASLAIEWSDDDYRTWSAPRILQLSSEFPFIRRLGRFRRRAFRLTHTANTPMRLEGMELNLDSGVS